jgi:hypothetical protein
LWLNGAGAKSNTFGATTLLKTGQHLGTANLAKITVQYLTTSPVELDGSLKSQFLQLPASEVGTSDIRLRKKYQNIDNRLSD